MQKESEILQAPSVKCREIPSFLKNWRGNWLYFFELMLESEEDGSLNLLYWRQIIYPKLTLVSPLGGCDKWRLFSGNSLHIICYWLQECCFCPVFPLGVQSWPDCLSKCSPHLPWAWDLLIPLGGDSSEDPQGSWGNSDTERSRELVLGWKEWWWEVEGCWQVCQRES